MRTHVLLLSASALALGWCGACYAAATDDSERVETVTVTADRRTVDLNKTAISATVLSAADIADKGVVKVDDLQFTAPSMVVNNFGQGIDFNIRGIGKGEHNTQTLSGVITYRDDVATFQGYFQEEPYFDVASVSVLRGPQGTFGGQNATGGAVFVKTQDAAIDGGWTGYLTGSYGNYNETKLEGAINIPVTDKFAMRLAVFGDARGSFFNVIDRDPVDACPGNKYAGCKPGYNPGDLKWVAARLSLMWKPVDRLTVSAKFDADYLDSGATTGNGFFARYKTVPVGAPAYEGTPGTANANYSDLLTLHLNYPNISLDRIFRAVVKAEYEFPDGIILRSVSQYARGNTNWMVDLDLSDTGSPAYGGAKNYSFYDIAQERLYTTELNLISPDSWRLNWVFGLQAQSDIYDFPQNPPWWIGVPGNTTKVPSVPAQTSDLWGQNFTAAYAVFGQIGFKVTEKLDVKMSGRYSIATTGNDVTWNQYGDQFTVTPHTPSPVPGVSAGWAKFYSLDYKAEANYQVNDNHFLYAFISTGFKPGGLNGPFAYEYDPHTFALIHVVPQPFGKEKVTSFEAGWKAQMLDGHLSTQTSAYYNDYKGFIVSVLYPASTGGFVFTHAMETNDPKATKAYGLELEADAVFGEFKFGAGLGLMHDGLGEFHATDARAASGGVGLTCDPVHGGTAANCVNLKDHPATYAPDVTYNISAEYRFHLDNGDKLTPRVSFGHQNPQWATLFDNAGLGDKLSARNLVGAQLEWARGDWVVTAYGTNLLDQHYVGALISGIDIPGAPRQFGIRAMKVF